MGLLCAPSQFPFLLDGGGLCPPLFHRDKRLSRGESCGDRRRTDAHSGASPSACSRSRRSSSAPRWALVSRFWFSSSALPLADLPSSRRLARRGILFLSRLRTFQSPVPQVGPRSLPRSISSPRVYASLLT